MLLIWVIIENGLVNGSGLSMNTLYKKGMWIMKVWKYCCVTTQFPEFQFCGPYVKIHGLWGLNKHYRLWFDSKWVRERKLIWKIPCVCAVCTIMLNKPWYPGVSNTTQPRYQHVLDCTYWPVFVIFNNCTVIIFTNKNEYMKDFVYINNTIIDVISDNMLSLVQLSNYGYVSTTDPKTT